MKKVFIVAGVIIITVLILCGGTYIYVKNKRDSQTNIVAPARSPEDNSTTSTQVSEQLPEISIIASPSLVVLGGSTTITWFSKNVAYCTLISDGVFYFDHGTAPLRGTQVVGPLSAPLLASFSCSSSDGTVVTKTLTVRVN